MATFRIVPIASDVATYVRTHLRAPGYGHPAIVEMASGTGPCRQCLRLFRLGEEPRALFTLDARPGDIGPPQPGPVFIHQDTCDAFTGYGIPDDLHRLPLFLEAFDQSMWQVRRVPVVPGTLAQTIETVLQDRSVAHVNIRNTEAGCFVARVHRCEDAGGAPM